MSIYSFFKTDIERKQEEPNNEEMIDPFCNPVIAKDNWGSIFAEYSGKEREGFPFA